MSPGSIALYKNLHDMMFGIQQRAMTAEEARDHDFYWRTIMHRAGLFDRMRNIEDVVDAVCFSTDDDVIVMPVPNRLYGVRINADGDAI